MNSDTTTPQTEHPGRVVSIVGLVFAFIGLSLIGLVLSIIGYVKSKRAHQSTLIGLLGIIFNSIAIVVSTFIIVLGIIGAMSAQAERHDDQKRADVQSIKNTATIYRVLNKTREYPRSDAAGFRDDITALNSPKITIDPSVVSKLSSEHPSESNKDIYHITYCGGDTAETATGLSVEYWKESTKRLDNAITGSGCDYM